MLQLAYELFRAWFRYHTSRGSPFFSNATWLLDNDQDSVLAEIDFQLQDSASSRYWGICFGAIEPTSLMFTRNIIITPELQAWLCINESNRLDQAQMAIAISFFVKGNACMQLASLASAKADLLIGYAGDPLETAPLSYWQGEDGALGPTGVALGSRPNYLKGQILNTALQSEQWDTAESGGNEPAVFITKTFSVIVERGLGKVAQ